MDSVRLSFAMWMTHCHTVWEMERDSILPTWPLAGQRSTLSTRQRGSHSGEYWQWPIGTARRWVWRVWVSFRLDSLRLKPPPSRPPGSRKLGFSCKQNDLQVLEACCHPLPQRISLYDGDLLRIWRNHCCQEDSTQQNRPRRRIHPLVPSISQKLYSICQSQSWRQPHQLLLSHRCALWRLHELQSPQWAAPPQCRRERRGENCWCGLVRGWRQQCAGTNPRQLHCCEALQSGWIGWHELKWSANNNSKLTVLGCCRLHPHNLLQGVRRDILPIVSNHFSWQQKQASHHSHWTGSAWKFSPQLLGPNSKDSTQNNTLHLLLSKWNIDVTSASSTSPSISSWSPE